MTILLCYWYNARRHTHCHIFLFILHMKLSSCPEYLTPRQYRVFLWEVHCEGILVFLFTSIMSLPFCKKILPLALRRFASWFTFQVHIFLRLMVEYDDIDTKSWLRYLIVKVLNIFVLAMSRCGNCLGVGG